MQFHKSKILIFCSVFALTLSLPRILRADDNSVQRGIEEAKKLYELRSADNPEPIEKILASLKELENQADDPELNLEVFLLESQALYWKGRHAQTKNDRLAIHTLGLEKAKAAQQVNASYAETYYYSGIHLSRWCEAKGAFASMSRKKELEGYLFDSIKYKTRTNEPGETLDGYGPDRAIGRIYHRVPAILGGSHTKAVEYLSRAVQMAKKYATNTVYFSDTLWAGNDAEKEQAKALLDELLGNDPKTYNPSRTPETLEEFEEGKALRKSMGN